MPIRGSLELFLRWSPVQVAFMLQAVRRLTVLAYHGIDDPASFRRQLGYLARTMRPVSMDDVLKAMYGGRSLPARAVLLTFDDGHRSLLEAGLPLLRERGFPATAFVIAGVLDTDQPFWWTETEQLVLQGGRAARLPGRFSELWVRHGCGRGERRALRRAGTAGHRVLPVHRHRAGLSPPGRRRG